MIVGGDSDFITLVEKLKQYDKQIFVVGGRSFTSYVMQRNCHEFIAYENLISGGRRSGGERGGRQPGQVASAQAPIEQVVPLVRRALKILSDREVSPQLGLLKSTLLQLDSTFSERTYGVSSFRDFADKLAAAGHVSVREMGRNVVVELTAAGEAAGQVAPAAPDEIRDGSPVSPRPEQGRTIRIGTIRIAAAAAATRPSPPAARPPHPRGATRRRSGVRDPTSVPVAPKPPAMADVRAPGEAVHAQTSLDVRRAEVRLQQHHGSVSRGAARRSVQDSSAIARVVMRLFQGNVCRPRPRRHHGRRTGEPGDRVHGSRATTSRTSTKPTAKFHAPSIISSSRTWSKATSSRRWSSRRCSRVSRPRCRRERRDARGRRAEREQWSSPRKSRRARPRHPARQRPQRSPRPPRRHGPRKPLRRKLRARRSRRSSR